MKLTTLEAALYKRPFLPFELRVDGDAVLVQHPEQVLLAAEKTTVIVDAADRIHIFDVPQISKLVFVRRKAAKAVKAATTPAKAA